MNGATALVSPGRTEQWPFLSSPGADAVIGIMTAGPIADALLHRGTLDARTLQSMPLGGHNAEVAVGPGCGHSYLSSNDGPSPRPLLFGSPFSAKRRCYFGSSFTVGEIRI